jgi:hypothetical protein
MPTAFYVIDLTLGASVTLAGQLLSSAKYEDLQIFPLHIARICLRLIPPHGRFLWEQELYSYGHDFELIYSIAK